MKQKILEALKTKYPGVSDTILNRIAEKLAKTVTTEEGVQPAVDAVTFQQIIEGEADRRATEATTTAVTNYEKKYGLKDGQKAQTGGGEDNNDPNKKKPETVTTGGELTLEAITAAINAANKPLIERLTAIETGKVSETRKQKLDAIIEKLPENLRKPYGRIDLTAMSAGDFDTFIAETTTEVEVIVTDSTAKGSVLQPPKPGGGTTKGKEPTKEETEAVVNAMF